MQALGRMVTTGLPNVDLGPLSARTSGG